MEVTIIDQDYMIRFFLKRIIFRASSLFLTLSCLHKKKINLRKVSIEVENLKDLEILCKYNPKNILLDNFSISQIKKAIKLCSNSKSSIEISGNISLSNIGSFKGLKIDYISIGDLTKNVESIDFSLLIEK